MDLFVTQLLCFMETSEREKAVLFASQYMVFWFLSLIIRMP